MMKLAIIGEKHEQTEQFVYILDNISNGNVYYINIDMDLNEEFKKILNSVSKERQPSKLCILFEIKKSNRQFQEKMISKLQNKYFSIQIQTFIILTKDKQEQDKAQEIKRKLKVKFNECLVEDLVQYFKNNFSFPQEIDVDDKQVVMLISKELQVKNKIKQIVNLPLILQNKWVLINTPQFCFNEDIQQREEAIKQFQELFKKYSKRISHFLFIVDQERTDTTKQNFNDMFLQLRKFNQKIVVLLYNRLNEQLNEDKKLTDHFLKAAKIKNFYKLENSQLENLEQIKDYFTNILTKEQQDDQIGIDLSDTMFQIPDENQEKEDKEQRQLLDQNFQLSILDQLEKSIQLLYQQKQKYLGFVIDLENQIQEQQHKVSELKLSLNIQQPNKNFRNNNKIAEFQLQPEETNYRQHLQTKLNSNFETEHIYVEKKVNNEGNMNQISNLEKEKEDILGKLSKNLFFFDIKTNSNLNNPSRNLEQLEKQNEQYLIRIDEIDNEIKKYKEQDKSNTNCNISLTNMNAVQNQQFQPQNSYQSNNYQNQQQYTYQYKQLGSPYYQYSHGV